MPFGISYVKFPPEMKDERKCLFHTYKYILNKEEEKETFCDYKLLLIMETESVQNAFTFFPFIKSLIVKHCALTWRGNKNVRLKYENH